MRKGVLAIGGRWERIVTSVWRFARTAVATVPFTDLPDGWWPDPPLLERSFHTLTTSYTGGSGFQGEFLLG